MVEQVRSQEKDEGCSDPRSGALFRSQDLRSPEDINVQAYRTPTPLSSGEERELVYFANKKTKGGRGKGRHHPLNAKRRLGKGKLTGPREHICVCILIGIYQPNRHRCM